MSAVFKELGATVESYDLDSKDNDYTEHRHKFADMNERLPIDSNHADIILCQEGIEHLQDQFFIFSEYCFYYSLCLYDKHIQRLELILQN